MVGDGRPKNVLKLKVQKLEDYNEQVYEWKSFFTCL